MNYCERCAQQPRHYCRQCERRNKTRRLAERLCSVYQDEDARVRFRGDAERRSFEMLPLWEQSGWLAVADAVATTER